jgi:hypothetical protein
MKSFKTVLNEGRLEERLFHTIIKGCIKKEWGLTKKSVCYYDADTSNNKDAGKFDLYGAVRIYVVENDQGDYAYDYEAI